MSKRIFVMSELCNGCRLCEMGCSFLRTKEFNPSKSLIKIFKVEDEGINIPLIQCDGSECLKRGRMPRCVELCTTGALIFGDLDEAVKKRGELASKSAVQPLFRVIAPWKWPYPWKEWPGMKEGG